MTIEKIFPIELNFFQPETDATTGDANTSSEQWIQLLPVGPVIRGRDGRQWQNVNPTRIVTSSELPMPVDYEHATATGAGSTAAAGWIEELRIDGGMVWGRVEWTPNGQSAVINKYWRFISPAIKVDESGEIMSIVSAGLTNSPNLEMQALNKVDDTMAKKDTTIVEPIEAVADVTEAVELNTATTQEIEKQLVPDAIAKQLGVQGKDLGLALNAITDLQSRVEKAEQALQTLSVQNTAKEIVRIVEETGRTKITPASRDGFVDYGIQLCNRDGLEKGIERFRSFVETLPAVAKEINFAPVAVEDNQLKAVVDGILKGARK